MPVFGSGFLVLTEISSDSFRDIVLSAFRSFSPGLCEVGGGVWYTDAVIDGAAQLVKLIQVSGDPPATHDDQPIPPIPFDELTTGGYSGLFDFEFWPLVRGNFRNRPHLKTVDGGAVAVGFELSNFDDLPAFAAFQANLLSIDGTVRDFVIAIDGDVLTGRVIRGLLDGPVFTTGQPIPMLSGPEPVISVISIGASNVGPVRWQQPWSFVADVELTIGTDQSGLVAPETAWLEVAGDGGLDLRVRILPQDIDPDDLDDFWPFATFSDAERNATAAKLVFAFATGIQNHFQAGRAFNAPDPVRVTALGEAVVRIYDPNFRGLPQGGDLPGLVCEGLQVTAESLVLYGSIQRTAPLPPHLVVSPSSVTFTEELASACGAADPPSFAAQIVQARNTGVGPLYICRHQVTLTGADAGHFGLSFSGPATDTAGNFVVQPGQVALFTIHYDGAREASASATFTIASNDPLRPRYPVALQAISGVTQFEVDPPALAIRRANNPMGRPGWRAVQTHGRRSPAKVRNDTPPL